MLVSGISVSIHYCQGEIEDINLMSQTSGCCCGDDEMADECCSNENLIIQFDSDEQLKSVTTYSFKHVEILTTEQEIFSQDPTDVEKTEFYTYTDSPPLENQKIWILNNTFTFYG
jgi:hypothetical protein